MRKLIIIFGLCICVALAGYAGYRAYRVWEQRHMLAMAHDFLAKSDERNAMLSLQGVLRVNPVNVDATRLMAQLYEAARRPEALVLRGRVVALNANSTPDRLALAQTALLFREFNSATSALAGVDAEGKKTAAYQNLAGTVAAAQNRLEEAELNFLEAARLEPTNLIPQMNLAVVLLHSTNALSRGEARTSLERIANDPKSTALHCTALRELVSDALRNDDIKTAEQLSQNLLTDTNSVFEDRLLRLNVLRRGNDAAFKSALATFQHEAATNSAKVYELATWQLSQNLAPDALAWLLTLPKETITNPAAMLVTAECRIALGDWKGLQTSLEKQKWGDSEFLRHAFLTRALRGQELTTAATGEWEEALRDTRNQKQSLIMLLSLAAQWNSVSDAQSILWMIYNQYPEEKWAYQTLAKALAAGGQTRSLMQLFSRQVKRLPGDIPTQNNLAMLALLLSAKELKPDDLAQEVYQKSPTNAAYASTYAFSLYLKNKPSEALAIMQKLDPKQLRDPSISGYYGLILKANGKGAEAKTYLDLSTKVRLLPEERKLMDVAIAGA